MGAGDPSDTRVFRASIHLYVVLGVLVGGFIALGISIGITRGMWTFLGGFGPVGLILLLLPRVLRLEIRPDGFTYRNLSGRWDVAFAGVERAYFNVRRAEGAPQGVAAFLVKPRDRKAVQVNLRTFPIRAAARLFTELERHGITIEVPDDWAARRVADQIRAEQAKLGPPAKRTEQDGTEPSAMPDPVRSSGSGNL